ncbi:MFS transporter, ACS family, solute carrier family 17 (sodium-dependent inorganic phosphate [Mytilus galloprovincialis]|uniref:Sialin n=1 Tax=Mytilus galloprovincialis TaxID=29158 RepID=A0A8B6F6C7_MYTGA|nr:MFS transporter, ACS family, solute carrier family 17 (sodium-dependent inorganic phosphate [Mytilus galloprovincialis]
MAAKATEQDDDGANVPCCCSQRWILAYVAYLGFLCLYAVRFDLSVAIVCMVKTSNRSMGNDHVNGTCPGSSESIEVTNQHAEFDWDKDTRANILSAFFYGYIITQIPGGWIADRFGGRRIIGAALLIGGICTILTPICARTSVILVYVVRAINGLASGVCFPAMSSVWGRWAPPLERTKLMALYYLGPPSGSVITLASSGYLCEYGFDNGWGSIFYITGGVTLLWVLLWFILIRDTPLEHPWITDAEKNYICKTIPFNVENKKLNVPWLAMAKSLPLYACLFAEVCGAWMGYTILTSIPDFMKSVLKFNIKSNGVFSALPNLCFIAFALIAGQSADWIRARKILSTKATRKVYQCSAFIGSSCCIVAAGFTTCDQRYVTVACICLTMACSGLSRAGYAVNIVDISGKYAGIVMGITNMCGNIPGILSPIAVGKLTPNDTREEWRNVFYVCAGCNIIGALIFGLLSSGSVQPWATDEQTIEISTKNIDSYKKIDGNRINISSSADKNDD